MSGVLSVCGRDYFGLPIVATCVHSYRKQTFKWTYKVAGIKVTNEQREYTNSTATTDPYDGNLFRFQTELDNKQFCLRENNDEYNELTRSILKKLNDYEFEAFSSKGSDMGLWDMLCFIIKRVVEINDDEIIFEICDMESISSILVYDRKYHGLYRRRRKTYSQKNKEFVFAHNQNGNTDKFYEVIKLIDNALKNKN